MPFMRMLRNALALILVFCLFQTATAVKSRPPEPKCKENLGLPGAVAAALKKVPDVFVSCRLDPFVLKGDFDGNGRLDYAVLVTQQHSGDRGVLIVFAGSRKLVIGAGRPVEYGAAPFADLGFRQWQLYPKSRPVESAPDQPILKLRGDALLVGDPDGASGLFYWNGKKIRWYQQGD